MKERWKGMFKLTETDGETTVINIPEGATDTEIDIVCGVSDDVDFAMTKYARVILKVE
jgi:hypothetical protein